MSNNSSAQPDNQDNQDTSDNPNIPNMFNLTTPTPLLSQEQTQQIEFTLKSLPLEEIIELLKEKMEPDNNPAWAKYYRVKARFANLFLVVRHYASKDTVATLEATVISIANLFFQSSKDKAFLFLALLGEIKYKELYSIELTEKELKIAIIQAKIDEILVKKQQDKRIYKLKSLVPAEEFLEYCHQLKINPNDYEVDFISEIEDIAEQTDTDKIKAELVEILKNGEVATGQIKGILENRGYNWNFCRKIAKSEGYVALGRYGHWKMEI